MATEQRALVDDLYHVSEHRKAELIKGELVLMPPTGAAPGMAGGAIYASLRQYKKQTGRGHAFPDNVGFVVQLPHRESFSPDASFYTGPFTGMRFLNGAPDFAVEVRSENDYGPKADRDRAEKRADYFTAGTLVVWDVDLLAEDVIRKYSAIAPDQPQIFRRGGIADAEPAVPGWTMPVDELFE